MHRLMNQYARVSDRAVVSLAVSMIFDMFLCTPATSR